MSTIRRSTTSASTPPGPERLPQRWAIILIASAGAAVLAFLAGGPLLALGTFATAITLLHTVME
ncbi:hypothetical protein ACFVJ4_41565 [Streptomyces sp. NPDC127178]|uniref:hypothetical protein n=1 Tax=unclassified Streptomyces TaxID=2593676 RepID=UPI003644867B